MRNRPLHVDRVPIHDRRDHQIEAGGAIALVLERAVGDPTLPVHVDAVRQEMPGLALVEAVLTAVAQLGAFEPVLGEERPLDPADLLQRQVQPVVALCSR